MKALFICLITFSLMIAFVYMATLPHHDNDEDTKRKQLNDWQDRDFLED